MLPTIDEAADPAAGPAADPHIIFGCDYCPSRGLLEEDGSPLRIRGPVRYTIKDEDVDCCPTCFATIVPTDKRQRFAKVPPDPEPLPEPAPPPDPEPAPPPPALPARAPPRPPPTYALWLMPARGPTQQAANEAIERLATLHNAAPMVPHVTIVSGFNSFYVAETAARAVAPLFRRDDGQRVALWLGSLAHEEARFRCVTAAVHPSHIFGEAITAAEKVKREHKGGMLAGVHHPPHLSLLYAELDKPARDDAVRAVVAASLVGGSLEPATLAVWDVSARPDHTQWSKLFEIDV